MKPKNSLLIPVWVILTIAAYFYLTNRIFGYACPSEILFGLPCPACGLTRAFLLLLKGDMAGSLRMNPMLLFIPVYFILVLLKKKNASENYLIAVVIAGHIVFVWRMLHSFGAEPLAYNANNVINLIARMF